MPFSSIDSDDDDSLLPEASVAFEQAYSQRAASQSVPPLIPAKPAVFPPIVESTPSSRSASAGKHSLAHKLSNKEVGSIAVKPEQETSETAVRRSTAVNRIKRTELKAVGQDARRERRETDKFPDIEALRQFNATRTNRKPPQIPKKNNSSPPSRKQPVRSPNSGGISLKSNTDGDAAPLQWLSSPETPEAGAAGEISPAHSEAVDPRNAVSDETVSANALMPMESAQPFAAASIVPSAKYPDEDDVEEPDIQLTQAMDLALPNCCDVTPPGTCLGDWDFEPLSSNEQIKLLKAEVVRLTSLAGSLPHHVAGAVNATDTVLSEQRAHMAEHKREIAQLTSRVDSLRDVNEAVMISLQNAMKEGQAAALESDREYARATRERGEANYSMLLAMQTVMENQRVAMEEKDTKLGQLTRRLDLLERALTHGFSGTESTAREQRATLDAQQRRLDNLQHFLAQQPWMNGDNRGIAGIQQRMEVLQNSCDETMKRMHSAIKERGATIVEQQRKLERHHQFLEQQQQTNTLHDAAAADHSFKLGRLRAEFEATFPVVHETSIALPRAVERIGILEKAFLAVEASITSLRSAASHNRRQSVDRVQNAAPETHHDDIVSTRESTQAPHDEIGMQTATETHTDSAYEDDTTVSSTEPTTEIQFPHSGRKRKHEIDPALDEFTETEEPAVTAWPVKRPRYLSAIGIAGAVGLGVWGCVTVAENLT